MTKVNKTSFIIVRVTKQEKQDLKDRANKAAKKFSVFVRLTLGLK